MFLANIHLENFRGIEKLSLDFVCAGKTKKLRKWTVILGENGMGKSNLLKAIALVTAGSDALAELLGKPSDWITYGEEFCLITATIQSAKGKQQNISLRIEQGDMLKDVLQKNANSLKNLDKKISKNAANYFLVGYGPYRRSAGKQETKDSNQFYQQIRGKRASSLFNRGVTFHSIETWAMDLTKKELKKIGNSLNQCLPDVNFHSLDKKNKTLLFETASGIVPLGLLSDGYQNMVVWMGDLLYYIAQVNKGLTEPFTARGVLLVDEIAVHLHPSWQRMLVSYLEKVLPNFQIIATTNAPLTAQQVPENCLYYLQKENGTTELKMFYGNPQLVRLEQLIRMPAFGLSTVKSVMVEKKTQAYRAAKDAGAYESVKRVKSRSLDNPATEKEDLADFLHDLPDATYKTPEEQKQLDLLAKIEKHLKSTTK